MKSDRLAWTLSALAVGALLAIQPAVAQTDAPAAPAAQAGPLTVPENQWTLLGDCPPDPLGRELEPGRAAYWVYEPAAGRFLRYGGYTPTDDNSLWTYDLAARTWANPVKVDYAWPPPADRPGAGAWWAPAYDAKRKIVWMHGGSGVASRLHGQLFNDIWQLDPAAGKFKAAGSKNYPRYGAPIVYDSRNDLIVRAPAYDGEWAAQHNREKTWVYDPNKNAWEGRPTKPMPKYVGPVGFVFDPGSGKCVYLGHAKAGGPVTAWTYDAAANAWQQLTADDAPNAPASRVYPGACYDPHNKAVLLYGGVGQPDKGYGYLHRGGGTVLDDTWALDVGKATWTRLEVGAPARPKLPAERGPRFILRIAMDYDTKLGAAVVSAPTFGVWALRYRADRSAALAELKLGPLPPFDKPAPPAQPVYRQAPPNKKLVDLPAGVWTKLGGGPCLGGGEVPWSIDEATGFVLKYGGCNNDGTTFASGYGNDLSAYDPATERWIGLRWVDPCGPPRPANGCTRYYAYDTAGKATWFVAGTAGNHLASATLPGFEGKPHLWRYDGQADRFEAIAVSGSVKYGTGVAGVFDRINNLLVINPKEAWAGPNVCLFDPAKSSWTDSGAPGRARAYTYPCFVDSLKAMMIIEPAKDAVPRTLAFDAAAKAWRDLAPGGDPLPATGRPTLAYDPDNDVVLYAAGGKTFAYAVKENRWKDLSVATPPISEMLVYDRRHKVFLGTGRGTDVHAFRYAR